MFHVKLFLVPGYSVTTLSDGASEYFVAGAPRANHSGQVIVYTVNSQKQLTVVDSERGKQVLTASFYHKWPQMHQNMRSQFYSLISTFCKVMSLSVK